VTYAVNSQWPGGFNAALVIQNTGTAAWKDWTLSWTFPTSAQKVTQLWNGTYSQAGSTVTVHSTGDNGAVPAGGAYSSVGFLGSWSGSNPAPTSFSVNGSPCN
jgi:endo-1,4-beta-xylanase